MRARSARKCAAAASAIALLTAPAVALAGECSITSFTLPVTMEGPRASVPVKVNGKDTNFWLDSGAWFSIMSQAKADELGLKTTQAPFGLEMSGVGGGFTPKVARIKDFAVVGSTLHNVDFLVGGSDVGNSLIGRNILTQADTEFDLAHGVVKIVDAKGCQKASMAYWAPGKPYFVAKLLPDRDSNPIHDLRLLVRLGDTEVNAAIDTGAMTLISRRAAERAGLDLKGPGVKPLDAISGFGRHYVKGWIVPADRVGIGDESILHAKLVVIDGPITPGDTAPEMLLGIDYLLAHHLYVSRKQNLIYFTYGGGIPFSYRDTSPTKTASDDNAAANATNVPAGMERVKAIESASQPTSPDEFARRAAARLAQRNATGAIADYSEAIRLAPGTAAYYRERARAHARVGDQAAANADFDQAIKLAPNNPELLLVRANIRLINKDNAGALADAEAAQKLIPPSSLDAASIASLYVDLGRAAYAIHLYDPIIAAHGNDVRLGKLLNGRCWSRALANVELEDALSDCNKALKLAGHPPLILDSRALVLFRQKEFAKALADYDAVLKANPNTPWSLYMRGLTHSALGQIEVGKAERDHALKLEPGMSNLITQYGLAD